MRQPVGQPTGQPFRVGTQWALSHGEGLYAQRRPCTPHAHAQGSRPAALGGCGLGCSFVAALPLLRLRHRGAFVGRQHLGRRVGTDNSARGDADGFPQLNHWQDAVKELLLAGEQQPFWFRVVDTVLTLSASACFVLSTIEPGRFEVELLRGTEDIINVFFSVGFVCLFWAHEFRLGWLVTPSALLDLASCLPVASILLRTAGDDTAAYAQLLQAFRFLRLLRETRLITKSDRKDIPAGAGIFVLSVGFLGLIAVCATVLYIYERDTNESVEGILDALLYMGSIFTARPPPFGAVTSLGKVVTILAFLMALIGIPFLVAEVTAFTMQMTSGTKSVGPKFDASADLASAEGSIGFWGQCLLTLDHLEITGGLGTEEAAELRRRCYAEQRAVAMVMAAYRREGSADERLTARLRECLRHQGDAAAAVVATSEEHEQQN